MKLTLDLGSAALGAALALALGGLTAFAPQAGSGYGAPHGTGRPAAADLVWIDGSSPAFVVPEGRILVLTGLGGCDWHEETFSSTQLTIDGVHLNLAGRAGDNHIDFGSGLPVRAGSTVRVTRGERSATAREWVAGYLEDVAPNG